MFIIFLLIVLSTRTKQIWNIRFSILAYQIWEPKKLEAPDQGPVGPCLNQAVLAKTSRQWQYRKKNAFFNKILDHYLYSFLFSQHSMPHKYDSSEICYFYLWKDNFNSVIITSRSTFSSGNPLQYSRDNEFNEHYFLVFYWPNAN